MRSVVDSSIDAQPPANASGNGDAPAPPAQQPVAQIKTQVPATQLPPSNGLTTCRGVAQFTGVGGAQAKADGAFLSPYPKVAGGSIKGGLLERLPYGQGSWDWISQPYGIGEIRFS